MTTNRNSRDYFVCSWSGGKDSCLALYYGIRQGGTPSCLLTIIDETHEHSRSHGLSPQVLKAQADCLGIPLVMRDATWDDYESVLVDALFALNKKGATTAVFGDIDIQRHLEWEKKVCGKAGMEAFIPLWQRPREELLSEFMSLGFEAMVVCVEEKKLGTRFLGKMLNPQLIEEFTEQGIDPSGELGEYHTVVTNGPLFKTPLKIRAGEIHSKDGYAKSTVCLGEYQKDPSR